MQHFLKITTSSLLLTAASLSVSQAVTYPEPEITSIMFHVDKLPLDPDRVKELTDDLVRLASNNANGNQEALNGNARLLAIALRLDAKNAKALDLNKRFANNERIDEVNPDWYQKTLGKTLHLVAILSEDKESPEAQVFANYLKDALKVIASNNPQIKDHQVNKKRWRNIVRQVKVRPPLRPEQGEERITEMPVDGDSSAKATDENLAPDKSEVDKPLPPIWNFLSSEITSPVILYKKDGDKVDRFWKVADFKLTWTPIAEESGKIQLVRTPYLDDGKRIGIEETLRHLLAKRWKEFPSAEVTLSLPANYSVRSGSIGMLPIATQLYASLKNTAVPAGIRMLGQAHSSGQITSGKLFWQQLKELRKDEELKQTLFCPLEAEKALTQLVALEEAEFFVRNEVILAKDIEEVTDYFGVISDEGRKLAHEKFVELQDAVGSRSVGSFSVDKKVRATLEEIIALNPNHLSAKMILLRGETTRSSYLDAYFVAEEFKSTLHSLDHINDSESTYFESEYLSKKAEEIDQQLESISRYIDRNESDFVKAMGEMSDDLNNMSRAMKKRDSDYHKRAAISAHDRFRVHYKELENYIKENQE